MRLVELAALEASAAAAVDAPTFMKNCPVAICKNGRMQRKRRQKYLAWRAAWLALKEAVELEFQWFSRIAAPRSGQKKTSSSSALDMETDASCPVVF